MGRSFNRQTKYRIRQATVADSQAVRALCVAGLKEHIPAEEWDERRNEDLQDPYSYYRGRLLIAYDEKNVVVGAGAIVFRKEAAFISRISVHREHRRQGLARSIVAALEALAALEGKTHVELETTDTWTDILNFWRSLGYAETKRGNGDQYFRKSLPRPIAPADPGK